MYVVQKLWISYHSLNYNDIRNICVYVLVSVYIIHIEIPENNYIKNIEYKIVDPEESTNNIFYSNTATST